MTFWTIMLFLLQLHCSQSFMSSSFNPYQIQYANRNPSTIFQLGKHSDMVHNCNRVFKKIVIPFISVFAAMEISYARPEGVSRPELLPKGDQTTIIDVANFLTKGQERKLKDTIETLQKNTGFKLRVLCQSYPNTPGLAIKDYWGVDDNTVLLVVDRGEGFNRKGIPSNILNLNIGSNVEDVLSNTFWLRLTNKLGNQPYVKKNGEDVAVINAVEAIAYCLQAKDCADIPFSL